MAVLAPVGAFGLIQGTLLPTGAFAADRTGITGTDTLVGISAVQAFPLHRFVLFRKLALQDLLFQTAESVMMILLDSGDLHPQTGSILEALPAGNLRKTGIGIRMFLPLPVCRIAQIFRCGSELERIAPIHGNVVTQTAQIPDHFQKFFGMNPDAEGECARYDAVIAAFGGADLQLLGLGPNGHIGVNEPCDEFVNGTNKVELPASTIDANQRFFEKREDVPTHAYTMGIGSIMKAKRVLLVVNGKNKAQAVKDCFFGPIKPQSPGSILQLHPDFTLVADEDALSLVADLL